MLSTRVSGEKARSEVGTFMKVWIVRGVTARIIRESMLLFAYRVTLKSLVSLKSLC